MKVDINKKVKTYSYLYTMRIVRKILSSNLCIKNPLYSKWLKNKKRKKMEDYEKQFLDNMILPEMLEIELTNRCNIACVFCPNEYHSRERGIMSFGTFKNVIDAFKDIKLNMIVISGFGESTLDKELVKKLEYLNTNLSVPNVSMTSNATSLKPELFEKICTQKLLTHINLSIDSGEKESYKNIHKKDMFEKIIHNLSEIQKIKVRKNTIYPILTARFKDFSYNTGEFRNFVKTFGNITDKIQPYANIFDWPDSGLGENNLKNDVYKEEKLIRVACPNLWKGMLVQWNGNVALCCQDYEGRVIHGNLNEKSVKEIWNTKLLQQYRKQHKDNKFNQKVCKGCDINSHMVMPI